MTSHRRTKKTSGFQPVEIFETIPWVDLIVAIPYDFFIIDGKEEETAPLNFGK